MTNEIMEFESIRKEILKGMHNTRDIEQLRRLSRKWFRIFEYNNKRRRWVDRMAFAYLQSRKWQEITGETIEETINRFRKEFSNGIRSKDRIKRLVKQFKLENYNALKVVKRNFEFREA